MIIMVLNGMYGSDNYCIFVSPLLSYIVNFMGMFLPFADNYVIFTEILMIFSTVVLAYVLLSITSRKYKVFLFWLLFITANIYLNLFHSNFTIYTSVVSVIGLFGIYWYYKKKVNIVVGILSFVIFALGGLFRFESYLLALPFFALAVFIDFIASRKDKKSFWLRLGIILFAVLVCVGGNKALSSIVSNSDYYHDSVVYNNARSSLVDYENRPWEEISEEFEKLGVSENDYECMKRWMLADTEIFTSKYLGDASSIAKFDNKLKIFLERSMLSGLWYVINNVTPFMLQTIAFISILLFLVLFSSIRKLQILEIILSYVGTVIIFIYLSIMGRLPERVIQSVFVYIWFIIMLVVFSGNLNIRIQNRRIKSVFAGMILFAALSAAFSANTAQNTAMNVSINSRLSHIDSFGDENKKYVWNVTEYGKYQEETFGSVNKLPSQNFMDYNISDGGWEYGQVYWYQYLSRVGMENPIKSLLETNVYYVSTENKCDIVLTYLREHYGEDIIVEQVDKTDICPIWKFSRQ